MENAASVGRGHAARTLGVPLLLLPGGTWHEGVQKRGAIPPARSLFRDAFP